MKKILPIVASVALLIIALSFAYYFVVFLPGKERVKQEQVEQERLETIQQEVKLQECLVQAHERATDFWNKMCETKGLKEDCSLPSSSADRAWELQTELKEDCFRQFPSD